MYELSWILSTATACDGKALIALDRSSGSLDGNHSTCFQSYPENQRQQAPLRQKKRKQSER